MYCRRFSDPPPSDEEVRFSTALSQSVYGLFRSLREHDKELAMALQRYVEKNELLERMVCGPVPPLALREIANVFASCILDCSGVCGD